MDKDNSFGTHFVFVIKPINIALHLSFDQFMLRKKLSRLFFVFCPDKI